MTNKIVSCYYRDKMGQLYGRAGGQLEFVSSRIAWKLADNGRYEWHMILRFTDHDHTLPLFKDSSEMIEGKYYEFEFPLAGDP